MNDLDFACPKQLRSRFVRIRGEYNFSRVDKRVLRIRTRSKYIKKIL